MNQKALAFPNPTRSDSEPGLTVRDYIAIEAMKGILSNAGSKLNLLNDRHEIAAASYLIANALIAESNK